MELRIGKTRFAISVAFFVVLILFLLLDHSGLAVLCLVGMLLHECGHLAAGWLMGVTYSAIRFTPFGIRMQRPENTGVSYGKELFISAAGCLINVLTALICFTRFEHGPGLNFGAVNAALGIFNLLPIQGLDGGSMLRIILLLCCPPQRAEAIVQGLSILLLIGLAIASMHLKSLPLVLLTAYLTAILLCHRII